MVKEEQHKTGKREWCIDDYMENASSFINSQSVLINRVADFVKQHSTDSDETLGSITNKLYSKLCIDDQIEDKFSKLKRLAKLIRLEQSSPSNPIHPFLRSPSINRRSLHQD